MDYWTTCSSAGRRSPASSTTAGSGPRLPARHGQNGRAISLGRKSWLFCGSDRAGERAAVIYSLIGTAKLNGIDPQAWLADVLARIADYPPGTSPISYHWNWQPRPVLAAA